MNNEFLSLRLICETNSFTFKKEQKDRSGLELRIGARSSPDIGGLEFTCTENKIVSGITNTKHIVLSKFDSRFPSMREYYCTPESADIIITEIKKPHYTELTEPRVLDSMLETIAGIISSETIPTPTQTIDPYLEQLMNSGNRKAAENDSDCSVYTG